MSRRTRSRLSRRLTLLKGATSDAEARHQLDAILATEPVLLRGYLGRLGGEVEPHQLRAVAELARRGVPTTRKAAVQAAARFWLPGCEALLIERLSDETDPAVLDAVVAGLAEKGSRASLEPLRALRLRRLLSRSLRSAVIAIEARHPLDGSAGSLSLVAEGEGGALSLASGAGEGAISPPPPSRPDGERRATSAPIAPIAPADPAATAWWNAMSAAPRKVPLSLRWVSLTVGDRGVAALVWVFLGQVILGAFSALVAWPWLALTGAGFSPRRWLMWALGLMMFVACARWLIRGSATRWRLLRDGVPSVAHTSQQDQRSRPNARSAREFRYHFDVLTEDGRYFRHSLPWRGRRLELEGDRAEPVIYLPGADSTPELLRFCRELSWVRLDRDGNLRSTVGGLALAAAVTAWVMVPTLLAFYFALR